MPFFFSDFPPGGPRPSFATLLTPSSDFCCAEPKGAREAGGSRQKPGPFFFRSHVALNRFSLLPIERVAVEGSLSFFAGRTDRALSLFFPFMYPILFLLIASEMESFNLKPGGTTTRQQRRRVFTPVSPAVLGMISPPLGTINAFPEGRILPHQRDAGQQERQEIVDTRIRTQEFFFFLPASPSWSRRSVEVPYFPLYADTSASGRFKQRLSYLSTLSFCAYASFPSLGHYHTCHPVYPIFLLLLQRCTLEVRFP